MDLETKKVVMNLENARLQCEVRELQTLFTHQT